MIDLPSQFPRLQIAITSPLTAAAAQLGAVARHNTGRQSWERISKLRGLLDLMLATVASDGDEGALIAAAAKCGCAMSAADAVRIFLVEDGQLCLPTSESSQQRRYELEEAGLAGYVAEVKHAVSIEHSAAVHPQFVQAVDWDLPLPPEAMSVTPLRDSEGHLAGIISAGKTSSGAFSIDDRVLLEALGQVAMSILRQARKMARARLESHATTELLSMLGPLERELPAQTVLMMLSQHARSLTNSARCRIFLCNAKSCALALVGDSPASDAAPLADFEFLTGHPGVDLVNMDWGKGIIGLVASTGEPLLTNRPLKHAAFDRIVDVGLDKEGDGSVKCASLLAMPVRTLNGAVGAVIELIDKKGGSPFTSTDMTILKWVAELCSKEVNASVELSRMLRVKEQSDVLISTCEALNTPIHAALMRTSTSNGMLHELAWRCKMLVAAEHCALYVLRPNSGIEFELVSHSKLSPLNTANAADASHTLPRVHCVRGRGLVGGVADVGGVRLLSNACADGKFDAEVDDPLGIGGNVQPMALVAVPDSSSKEECIAVLQVVNKLGKESNEAASAFDDCDARVLMVYGRLMGWVLSHVSRISHIHDSVSSMSRTLEVAVLVISSIQPQSLNHNIALLANKLVPCEWSTLYLADDSNNKLLYQVIEGRPSGPLVKAGEGAPGLVAQVCTHLSHAVLAFTLAPSPLSWRDYARHIRPHDADGRERRDQVRTD